MGGKSSKQKNKKNKNEEGESGEGEEQTQEQKETGENGKVVTDKSSGNESRAVAGESTKSDDDAGKSSEVYGAYDDVSETPQEPSYTEPESLIVPSLPKAVPTENKPALEEKKVTPAEDHQPVEVETEEKKPAEVVEQKEPVQAEAPEEPATDEVQVESTKTESVKEEESIETANSERIEEPAKEEPAATEDSARKEEPVREEEHEEPTKEQENPVKEDEQEKLDVPSVDELPPPPEPAAEEESEAVSSDVQTEQVQNNSKKITKLAKTLNKARVILPFTTSRQKEDKESEGGESAPAAPSDTAETGAATSSAGDAAEAGETAAPSEVTAPASVPTEFKWEDGGETVLISGSFDSWQEKIALSKSGDIFSKTIDLPVGEYLYKFFVDDQWLVNKKLPTKCDESGQENNVLLVQPVS